MKKTIIILMAGLLSLPALADLDHNKKYGIHDEIMRGTTFPIQDMTLDQTMDLPGQKKLNRIHARLLKPPFWIVKKIIVIWLITESRFQKI